jgi:hypothetical protein
MNLGDKALQVLKTIAPMLGTAIGGPFGTLAGTALASILPGAKPDDDAATAAALLNATPDQLLALKKADQDFQAQLKSLGIQEEQLAYSDTASARAREIAVRDNTPKVLAYGVTVGFFSVLGYVMHVGLRAVGSGQGGEAVLIMLGSLGTAWAGIMSYYFGSSTGQQKNAETIAQIAKQP